MKYESFALCDRGRRAAGGEAPGGLRRAHAVPRARGLLYGPRRGDDGDPRGAPGAGVPGHPDAGPRRDGAVTDDPAGDENRLHDGVQAVCLRELRGLRAGLPAEARPLPEVPGGGGEGAGVVRGAEISRLAALARNDREGAALARNDRERGGGFGGGFPEGGGGVPEGAAGGDRVRGGDEGLCAGVSGGGEAAAGRAHDDEGDGGAAAAAGLHAHPPLRYRRAGADPLRVPVGGHRRGGPLPARVGGVPGGV